MLEANGRINLCLSRSAQRPGRASNEETTRADARHSQPRDTVFQPDLYRLRLRQGEGTAGDWPAMDEFLPALCFVAGVAVRDHVEDAVRATEQSAIPDCDDPRYNLRLRAG